MALKHKTLPAGTDRPGFGGVTPSLYAEEHLFSGGADGSVLVRNTGSSDGAEWIATANGVLTSTGAATLPSFATTLPNAVQDNITRLGTLVSGATGAGFTLALATSTISGDLPDANLSANVPLLNAVNVFTQTITTTGVFVATGSGTHDLSASNAGAQRILLRNTNTGAAAVADILLGNDSAATTGMFRVFGSNLSPSTALESADGVQFTSSGVGGLAVSATNAAGTIRFFTGGTTERARIKEDGAFVTYASDGSTEIIEIGDNYGAGAYTIDINETANGTGAILGNGIHIGRNTSGNGAAGFLQMANKNGGEPSLWVDAANDFRIGTAPREDGSVSDTNGTVVGTQTSQRHTKNIFGMFSDNNAALNVILQTPIYNFSYKSGAYSNTKFVGIVAEDSPEFAMDAGRSFNPISAFGYTVAAIKALNTRITKLENK